MMNNVSIDDFDSGNGLNQQKKSHFQLSFLDLNNNILIYVFSYLNWIDSIHLAETCVRLHNINFWKYKTQEAFDFNEYLERIRKMSTKNRLTAYGPHVRVLSTHLGDKNIQQCVNVQSLRIYQNVASPEAVLSPMSCFELRRWINKLNLESLWFMQRLPKHFQLCDNVTNLKELQIKHIHNMEFYNFLGRNAKLERLSIVLCDNYNLGIFINLRNLQCLHIKTNNYMHLHELIKYGNIDILTEFSINYCSSRRDELNLFFLDFAEKTKLEKLKIETFMNDPPIEKQIFRAIELFNLSALSLHCRFSSCDFSQFIKNPAPRLKYLQMRDLLEEDILFLVQNRRNVEYICCSSSEDYDYGSFYNKIIKLSTDRRPLTLEIHFRNFYTERIEFNFDSQKFRVIDVRDDELTSRCVMSNVFGFNAVSGIIW